MLQQRHQIHNGNIEELIHQIGETRHDEQLILVSGMADQRLLLRSLQQRMGGFFPQVELVSRQLANWLKFSTSADDSVLYLNRPERRLALQYWLEHIARPENQVSADRLDRMLAYLYRNGIDPSNLPAFFDEMGMLLQRFTVWCEQRGWCDRAGLFLKAGRVPPTAIHHTKIHLFHTGALPEYEYVALRSLQAVTGDTTQWHWYAPDETVEACSVGRISAHHERNEWEHVLTQIKRQVAGADETHFSDYVVLAADFPRYQALIPEMQVRFGIPVTAMHGGVLMGDPAITRLRTLLFLRNNGFQIDHVMDVFADQAISLQGLGQNESQSPNLRTFSRLCRRYNLRDLQQLETGLERALELEGKRRAALRERMGETEAEIQARGDGLSEAHITFYRNIRETLVRLNARFPDGDRPLSQWFSWALVLLESTGTIKDAALLSAREVMMRRLRQRIAMLKRLQIDPLADAEQFTAEMDAMLDGNIPVANHPGHVLLAPLDDTFCVENKNVYVLGLSDAVYPPRRDMEEVFPGMTPAAMAWLTERQPDTFAHARLQLHTLAALSRKLVLSCPDKSGSMASALLADHAHVFPHWHVVAEEVSDLSPFADTQAYALAASQAGPAQAEQISCTTDLAHRAQLTAFVAAARANPAETSAWEGQLQAVPDTWKTISRNLVQTAWDKSLRGGRLRMSVSRLDEFAASPLEYFFKRVLRLEPPETYTDEAEQNQKGDLFHAILEAFYSNELRFGEPIDPATDLDAARNRIHTIAETLFLERPDDLGYADTPFPGLLKNRIRRAIDAFVMAEHEGLPQVAASLRGQIKPAVLWGSDTPGTEVAFALELDADGIPVLFNGFVDRVDRSENGDILLIFDYKTGGDYSIKSFTKEMLRGLSFQLPLYVKAMSIAGKTHILAGYYHIRIDKGGDKIRLRSLLGEDILAEFPARKNKDFDGVLSSGQLQQFVDAVVARRVVPVVKAIRDGRFHQSLTKPSQYSEYSGMSRWSEAVTELRKLSLSATGDASFEKWYVEKLIWSPDEQPQHSGE